MKTTKIKGKNWNIPLSQWTEQQLERTYADGAVEEAQAKARNVAAALGRLLQLMVDQKRITVDEFFSIVGWSCYDEKPEAVEEEEE